MQRRSLETLVALGVIVVLFYFLLVRVILVREPARPAPMREFEPTVVQTRSLASMESWPALELFGNLTPNARLQISAEIGGRVVARLDGWHPGREVSKGELLFAVDPKPLELARVTAQARLAEAEAARISAKVEVQAAEEMMPLLVRASEVAVRVRTRLAGLLDTGESSASMVDGALAAEVQAQLAERTGAASLARASTLVAVREAAVQTALGAVAQAQDALRHLTFFAPFSGTLTSDGPDIGALLTPGGSLFSGATLGELVDLERLRMLVQVHESKLMRVEVGATALIDIPAMPGVALQGEVLRIAPVADPLTRSLAVEVRVKQPPSQRLPAGVFARAHIAPPKTGLGEASLWIERSEFIWSNGQPVAFTIRSEGHRTMAVPHPLDLGPAIGEGFLVARGLRKGAELIIDSLDRLDASRPIRITTGKP